jgi:hypothetical protein
MTCGVRPAVAGHLAMLIAEAPPGTLEVAGLTRVAQLDAIRQTFSTLDWGSLHVVDAALGTGAFILTTDPAAYAGVPLSTLEL